MIMAVKKKTIKSIVTDDNVELDDSVSIANKFNSFFSNIGKELADKIVSNSDRKPIGQKYINPKMYKLSTFLLYLRISL